MATRFFTNENTKTLLKKFQGVFENNKDIENFDALVGYFRASGYFQIRPFLDHVPRIRILVGINVDNILAKYQARGLLFQGDAGQTLSEFLSEVKTDIQRASYHKENEEGILQFIEDIASKKIEIKAHPSKKLHAKIYIFRPENWNEHRAGHVITGSSNLTESGLGKNEDFNYEFNVLLNNYDDVKFASDEFERLWLEGVPVLPAEIDKVKTDTYLNDTFTPFEVYTKFLIEYFGKSVEFDPNSITDLPKGFMRLTYQLDAVNEGYKLMKKHNGFFLSDVVGLGKTIVSVLIAKKFFYSNDFPSHISNTLIVIPPSMRDNWEDTLERFQLSNYHIITNGSLHKLRDAEKYDLVLVDEAHKFRNDTAEAYNELQKICKTPTRRRLPDGSRAEKKVILISATPLNNRPEDIANQVYLFQDAKDSTLEVSNLQHFFWNHIEAYRKLKKNPIIEEVQEGVKIIYKDIREKVIQPLTVRRTRRDLLEHEQYRTDLIEQNIVFPDIEKPRKIFYELDSELEKLYDRTMELLSHEQHGIQYMRYQAIKYLKPEKKAKYKNADVASQALAKIMKTLLVKRIDSSFHAFKESLNRFTTATQAMVKMFEQGVVYIAPELNVTQYVMEEREDELLDKMLLLQATDPTIAVFSADDFVFGFKEDLQRDYEILARLNMEWKKVKTDPKLNEFVYRLKTELLQQEVNPGQKLVIFSESKETTNYLVSKLKDNGRKDVLEINAGNRARLKDVVKVNFDANIPQQEYQNKYNIIISTEVLAEGINLHRSNIVVNYDTPWNSTRLMQRIGRINRIGSVAPKIYIYNFYPTAKVNSDIELEKRAIMKLQAFHSALGEDSEIYSPDEQTQSFGLFDKQVDEERDEKLAFLMELRKFKDENPQYFRKIRNMPLRARTGRKSTTLDGTTICFIRNNRRDAFYFVKEDNSLDELTFVETAKEFHAMTSEHPLALHDKHHDQVNVALADFQQKVQEEITNNQVVDTTQGPNEKKALAYLQGFLGFDFASAEDKALIRAAKHAIKMGKFQKLQRDVNKLKKDAKAVRLKPLELLDMMLEVIKKYPILQSETLEEHPLVSIRSFEKLNPEIIISESFSVKK